MLMVLRLARSLPEAIALSYAFLFKSAQTQRLEQIFPFKKCNIALRYDADECR